MPDFETKFPYGLKGSGAGPEQLKKAFARKLVILLGTEDIDPNHKGLRKTIESQAQGRNRLERGENFYHHARKAAEKNSAVLNWELVKVQGADHSSRQMSREAARILIQANK